MSNLSQFFSGGPRVWVSGTTYAIGNIVLSPADNYQQYVRITNGAGTTDPASDTTNYRPYGGRAIKSIQRGESTMAAATLDVTVSSVNTAKAELHFCGYSIGGATSDLARYEPIMSLTSATNIRFEIGGTFAIAATISWQLVEFY